MKITKWFLLAMLALLCCACAKNDPLAYVDEDADEVAYFNLTGEFSDEIWDENIKSRLQGSLGKKFFDDKGKFMGLSLKKNPAKIAVWKKYKKSEDDGESVVRKAVIVFEDYEATEFLDDAAHWYEDQGDNYEARDKKIDDCKAIVCSKKVSGGEDEDEDEEIEMTIIASGKNVVQIIWSNKKASQILEPEKACEAAGDIDSKATFSYWTSAARHRDIKEKVGKKVLDLGNSVGNWYVDGDEITMEGVTDISELTD